MTKGVDDPGGLLLAQRRKSFSDRVFGELGHGMDVELQHDLAAVGFHGFRADAHAHRDFLGMNALGKELEHLPLPRGEHGEGREGILPAEHTDERG